MSSAYSTRMPQMNQGYAYRPPAPHGQAPAGPPLDDVEHWFMQPSPNNRMVLALESGITSEVSWALSRLIRISASDRPTLTAFTTLPDALCQWPEWFLEHGDDEDSITFSPSPMYTVNRRLALNSLLVLKNTAIGEEGAGVLAKCQRVRRLLFRIMEQYKTPTDSTLEFLLTAMDIFRYTVQKWPTAPSPDQINSLVSIVGGSNDRAILISGWSSLHNLLDTFTTVIHVKPDSEALNAAIRALPLTIDSQLTTAALDYILAHVSHPALAKAFLHHPEMPQVLRLLVQQLLWDQQKLLEQVTVKLGDPVKTVIAQNNAIGLLELSREELDELSTLSEPSRVTNWMQRVFEVSPRAEMTQVTFWNLYKSAFATYGTDLMLPATDLIKTVTAIFPTAMAMVIPGSDGKPSKFVIKGLEQKRAAAEGRTKCHWDRWGCPEPAFASPSALYTHVQSHIALNSTITRCRWGSCTHQSPTTALFDAHLLTHLPTQLPITRHPGQVDDLIVPANFDASTTTPIARPIPPGPQQQMVYTKTREDPASSSFSSLLIMRILFRTSFTQAEVVMKTDGDHFGFPGIEQPLAEGDDGPATDDLGFDPIEGQRRGKAAFKAVGGMLARVQIHDQAISGWIDEMVDIVKSLPVSL